MAQAPRERRLNFDLAGLRERAMRGIAHNLGVIDERRAPDGSMRMRWLHFRTQIAQGDQVYVLDDIELPFQLPGKEESRVQVDVVVAEREFQLGERVTVTARDLLQIALLYQMIIERLAVAIRDRAREAGVVFPDPPADPDPGPPAACSDSVRS